MSNTAQVEPTEEQRQAAAAFVARHGEQNEVIDSGGQARLEWSPTHTADDIARFLAEREASAMCKGAAIASGTLWDNSAPAGVIKEAERVKGLHNAASVLSAEVQRLEALCTEEARLIVERDTLRARVAELEAKIADGVFSCPGCGRHDFGFFASQIKAACGPCRTRAENAEARVAELEAERGDTVGCEGCGKRLPYACAIPTEDPVYLCARCVSPMPRRRRLATEGRCAMSEPVIKATGARWCPKCRYASDGNRYGAPWMHCSFCDVDTVDLYTRDDLVRVVWATAAVAGCNACERSDVEAEVDRITKGET